MNASLFDMERIRSSVTIVRVCLGGRCLWSWAGGLYRRRRDAERAFIAAREAWWSNMPPPAAVEIAHGQARERTRKAGLI